jgi:hypothetical protein
MTDPRQVADAIVAHFRRGFVYTLDPPKGTGDPVVNFLARSKAGHCEYFASATAMMLASRGIPARLVTGSYGGEVGAFSDSIVVRGGNLHAWVEAKLDDSGFQIVEPTPPSGVPPATARVSWWKRLLTVGRSIEVFYDRRILGFDSSDQVQLSESFRDSLNRATRSLEFWKGTPGAAVSGGARVVIALFLLAIAGLLALRRRSRHAIVPPTTRAYLALRRLLRRRIGGVGPAVAPAEVVRLFEAAAPGSSEDATAVVRAYCEHTFGGRSAGPETVRELGERLRRLRKLAS